MASVNPKERSCPLGICLEKWKIGQTEKGKKNVNVLQLTLQMLRIFTREYLHRI